MQGIWEALTPLMVLSASVGNRLLLRFFGPRQSVQVIAVRTALVVLALPLGLTEQVSHLRHIAPETLRRLALDWCHVQRGSARVAARGTSGNICGILCEMFCAPRKRCEEPPKGNCESARHVKKITVACCVNSARAHVSMSCHVSCALSLCQVSHAMCHVTV